MARRRTRPCDRLPPRPPDRRWSARSATGRGRPARCSAAAAAAGWTPRDRKPHPCRDLDEEHDMTERTSLELTRFALASGGSVLVEVDESASVSRAGRAGRVLDEAL